MSTCSISKRTPSSFRICAALTNVNGVQTHVHRIKFSDKRLFVRFFFSACQIMHFDKSNSGLELRIRQWLATSLLTMQEIFLGGGSQASSFPTEIDIQIGNEADDDCSGWWINGAWLAGCFSTQTHENYMKMKRTVPCSLQALQLNRRYNLKTLNGWLPLGPFLTKPHQAVRRTARETSKLAHFCFPDSIPIRIHGGMTSSNRRKNSQQRTSYLHIERQEIERSNSIFRKNSSSSKNDRMKFSASYC